ncbi:MAG: biotin--[acetyl-CoA-carboxylase] ligase [Bacteroidota bacterium]
MITPTYIFEESIDSTNSYLQNIVDTGNCKEATVVYCAKQTSGRGQGSNKWESNPNENCTFSVYINPSFLKASEQFYFNKAICLSVCELVEKYSKVDEVKIKWPNDIYVQDKKIAGILIEHAVLGDNLYSSITGIGLNVNQTIFKHAPNPTSLKLLNNEDFDVLLVLNDLVEIILKNYYTLKVNCRTLDEAYKDKLYRLDEWAEFSYNKAKIVAKIIDVNTFGQLLLLNENNEVLKCSFKEIAYVI